jgi:hypothetical protein
MIGRPAVVLALAIALLGSLSITAFAISLPGVSAPQAHDLPRIVSALPTGSSASTATSTTGSSATPTASTGSSSGSTSHTSGTAGQGSSTSGPKSTPSDGDGDEATSNGGSSDHEVVSPHLHESDGDGDESGKKSSDAGSATRSAASNALKKLDSNRYTRTKR